MVTKKIHLAGSDEALQLFGQHDRNLRALEQSYGVQIFGRGDVLSIRGAPGKVEKALLAIDEMRDNLGRENHPAAVGSAAMGSDPNSHKGSSHKGSDPLAAATYTNNLGKAVRPRTTNQKAYVNAI